MYRLNFWSQRPQNINNKMKNKKKNKNNKVYKKETV